METVGRILKLAERQFGLHPAAIDVDVHVRDLDVDSLEYFEFLLEVEQVFGVDLDYAEATRVPTIRRVAGLVDLASTRTRLRVS